MKQFRAVVAANRRTLGHPWPSTPTLGVECYDADEMRRSAALRPLSRLRLRCCNGVETCESPRVSPSCRGGALPSFIEFDGRHVKLRDSRASALA